MQLPESNQILESTKAVLTSEGKDMTTVKDSDTLTNQILPALANTRDIQTAFYSFQPPASQGMKVVKNTLLRKFKNIIINVMERTVIRQQKYNELTYQAIVELKAQVDELKRNSPKN